VWDPHMTHDSFMCETLTWLMTHLCVRPSHDSWLIYVWDLTLSRETWKWVMFYMTHCGTWLMSHSGVSDVCMHIYMYMNARKSIRIYNTYMYTCICIHECTHNERMQHLSHMWVSCVCVCVCVCVCMYVNVYVHTTCVNAYMYIYECTHKHTIRIKCAIHMRVSCVCMHMYVYKYSHIYNIYI